MFKFIDGDGEKWEYDINPDPSKEECQILADEVFGSAEQWQEIEATLKGITLTFKGSFIVKVDRIPLEDSMTSYDFFDIPPDRQKYVIQRKDTGEYRGKSEWVDAMRFAKLYTGSKSAYNAWEQIRSKTYNHKPGFKVKTKKVGVYLEQEIQQRE